MTKFFEPIKISATHIYHSALELCPISSIVRELYYDQYHGVTRFPRVVIGTPDSWDTAISVSSKHGYGFCTWSPCGQFIAAQTGQSVEIRNPLTFELLTILQSSKYTPLPTSPLAYSPDGRSLACCHSGGILIWDIQTGGVANEIRCNEDATSLAWSLDGSMLVVTFSGGFITEVETFNIFSGAQLFSEQFEAEASIYLWAHNKSFRLIKAVMDDISIAYTISEIGPTLVEIESSSVMIGHPLSTISEITFSPSTYCIAILDSDSLFVYDICTSHRLLRDYANPSSFRFSPDGSHFAHFRSYGLSVFQCTSDSYTLLWQSFPLKLYHGSASSLQFSPTSYSILSQLDGVLQVRRLSDPPITSGTSLWFASISRSGRRIATAHWNKTAISIIDLHSRAPSQFIDTGFRVWSLDITGNVLVATGCNRATGWLLTEEGTVDGVFDDQRASGSDSKWTLSDPSMEKYFSFNVEGVVGVIQAGDPVRTLVRYNIETGDFTKPQCSRSTSLESQSSRSASPQPHTQGRLCHHLRRPLHILQCSPQRRLANLKWHNARGSVGNRSRRDAQVLGTCRVEEILGSS